VEQGRCVEVYDDPKNDYTKTHMAALPDVETR
jgi:ABC-type microcin C transport system duplicated ATPase subunit YejF